MSAQKCVGIVLSTIRMKTCTIEGCDKKRVAKGLCEMHRSRERRAAMPKSGNPAHRPAKAPESAFADALQWLQEGLSYREVAETTGIPKTTLRERFPGYGWTYAEGGSLGKFVIRPEMRKWHKPRNTIG